MWLLSSAAQQRETFRSHGNARNRGPRRSGNPTCALKNRSRAGPRSARNSNCGFSPITFSDDRQTRACQESCWGLSFRTPSRRRAESKIRFSRRDLALVRPHGTVRSNQDITHACKIRSGTRARNTRRKWLLRHSLTALAKPTGETIATRRSVRPPPTAKFMNPKSVRPLDRRVSRLRPRALPRVRLAGPCPHCRQCPDRLFARHQPAARVTPSESRYTIRRVPFRGS
jgi:hypothetical protein